MIDIPIRGQYKEVLTRTIAVYDTASKSSTSAYKQDKNNYYILALEQDWLVVCLQNSYICAVYRLQMQKSITPQNIPGCLLSRSLAFYTAMHLVTAGEYETSNRR